MMKNLRYMAGTHEELLKSGGKYALMWQSQNEKFVKQDGAGSNQQIGI